ARTAAGFASHRRRGARHSPALARAGRAIEQTVEPTFRPEQVLERVTIEHVEERVERIAQHALQHARRRDHARTGRRPVEAWNDMERAFDLADDVAEADLGRGNTEPEPAPFAAQRLEITSPCEMLNHLHQVIT